MKQTLIVLFLILFISCGGTQKPPVVTPPPAPTPAPGPEPQPGPEPLPDPVPIVKRDHSKFRSLGFYSLLSQPETDLKKVFALLPKEINFLSAFGLSGWLNRDGFYPWAKKGTGYDYEKIDPEWRAFITQFFTLAAQNDVGIEWCFFTRYLSSGKWGKYADYGAKNTPYCSAGINLWCNDSKSLYENWNRRDLSCKSFAWLCWKTGAADSIISVTPGELTAQSKTLGAANILYVRTLADIARDVRKAYPNFRIYVRPFNEETNDEVEDHRIENWIDKEFRDRGFRVGQGYRVIDNGAVWINLPGGGRAHDLGKMKQNLNWLKARNRWYEVHNCDSALAKKMIQAGFDMKSLVCDMDAVDDDQIDIEAPKLLQMNLPNLGIKPSDRWVGAPTKDINKKFQDLMPELQRVFRR